MNTLELINTISAVHGLHPDAPIAIPPSASPPALHQAGVVVIADTEEVLGGEPPGAPTESLVCYSTNRMSAVLDRVQAQAADNRKHAVAVLIPVDPGAAQHALVGDLVSGIHLRYEGEA